MPDIVIAGATFRGVPQIDIPKEGSGTASFVYEDGTKQITQNGTGIDVSGYAAVDVAVPSSSPVIQSLSVTQNGEYAAPSGVDGYSPVSVSVPGIVPSGSQTVTENGTYDVTALAEMVVNVSGGGGGGASNVVIGTFTGTADGAMDINLDYSGNGYPIAVHVFASGSISRLHQYAVASVAVIKTNMDTTPSYSQTDADKYNGALRYRGTTSGSYSQGGIGPNTFGYADEAASLNDRNSLLRIRNNKKLSVIIGDSGYCFKKDIEYTYTVVYSA